MAAKSIDGFLSAKRAFGVFGFLLVVWGFYRLVFRFPEAVEELIFKPIVWLGVVAWMLHKEGRGWSSIGLVGKDLFRNIYFGLGLGMLFSIEGVLANIAKYGRVEFVDLGMGQWGFLWALALSVATAFSEELVFRGYILRRLFEASNSKVFAVVVSSILFAAIHVPIWVFVYKFSLAEISVQFLVSMIFAGGNGVLAGLTDSIVGPVMTHVVWGWAVALFR